VCLCVGKVACVKSRDMHWALVAHRDQRDINLSSLRMLVVADGSNPCELSLFFSFLSLPPSSHTCLFLEILLLLETNKV